MSLARAGLDLSNFLGYLVRRQEVIASNIANADTPGYRSADISKPVSFSDVLGSTPVPLELPGNLPARNDGNNVSLDRESRLLAENTLRFNLTAQMLRGQLKDIRSAIEEGRAA